MATKIQTPSVSVLPLCLFHIRKCFKSVNIIFLGYFFFCNVCCSFFKQQNIRTVFFPVLSFQWDRKNEILNVVSANLFLLLFPSFYPFCFLAWFLFICFSIFSTISYYIYFFLTFFIILFAVDELFVCL